MRRLRTLPFFFLVLCFFANNSSIFAQNAGLSLTWDGTKYVVKMEVVTAPSGSGLLLLGASQVSIVVPAYINANGLVVTCVAPCNVGAWVANTVQNAWPAFPNNDFVAVATLGGNMGTITAGSSITLFTFTLAEGCDPAVRLFINGTDPSSAQMPNGGDFGNTLVNGLLNFEFYNGNNNNNVICAVVPLDLLSFGAKWQGKHAQLDWETRNETEMRHFDLQRSTDGQRFQTIATLAATNRPEARYAHLDTDVPKANAVYYRLEQVGTDGGTDVSPVRILYPNTLFSAQIMPNPASDRAVLRFVAEGEQTAQVRIFDITGKLVLDQSHPCDTPGEQTLELDLATLPAGAYQCHLTLGNGRVWQQRLVVQTP
jgi:hypothetical protein